MTAASDSYAEAAPGSHGDVLGPVHILLVVGTAVVGAVASIATVWLLVQTGKEAPSTLISTIYLAGSNIAFMVGIVYLALSYRNAANQNSKLRQTRERLDSDLGHVRALYDSALQRNLKTNNLISRDRMLIAYAHTDFCADLVRELRRPGTEAIAEDLERYLTLVLDGTSKLFTSYTGNSCASCIKMFEVSGGQAEAAVWTLKRDSGSAQLRTPVDDKLEKYEYHKNTAFEVIYAMRHAPDFYVEENLPDLERDGKYVNENEDWKNYYDAVAVVPIRPGSKDVRKSCVGFLCVDNKGGGFDRERTVHILNGIASDLYYGINTSTLLLGKLQRRDRHA